MLRYGGALDTDSTRTDSEYFTRHEKEPIVVSLVRVVKVIGGRDNQAEILENEGCLEITRVESNVGEGSTLESSYRD